MKSCPLLIGGVVAGLMIVAGEAVLNLALLAKDWTELIARLSLPAPTPLAAAQGVFKLLLLGIFSVWLADMLNHALPTHLHAAILSGLCIWALVWAWVQWGMLLAGYVTPVIAAATVAWGLAELPLAVCAGAWVRRRLSRSQLKRDHR